MADLATAWQWQPSEMFAMSLEELMDWHQMAVASGALKRE